MEEGSDYSMPKIFVLRLAKCRILIAYNNLQGKISGNNAIELRNSPESDKVGYDLKIEKIPRSINIAKRGSWL